MHQFIRMGNYKGRCLYTFKRIKAGKGDEHHPTNKRNCEEGFFKHQSKPCNLHHSLNHQPEPNLKS